MANKKISELPAATTPLTGDEELEIVQGGTSKKTTANELGGTGTLQETLDEGSTLDKDNSILTGAHEFEIVSGDENYVNAATQVQQEASGFNVYAQNNGDHNDGFLVVTPTICFLKNQNNDNGDAVELDITSTDATLTKNGVTKPIATVNYKVYTALLSQSGTSAPTANAFQNTLITDNTWQYVDEGNYTIPFDSPIPVNKIWGYGLSKSSDAGQQLFPILLGNIGGYFTVSLDDDGANANGLIVRVYNDSFSSVNLSALFVTYLSLPEIRVMP